MRVLAYGGLTLSDEERQEGLCGALAALAAGRMRIPIDRTIPLEHVNDPFGLLDDRALTGKVVLDLT